MANQQQQKKSLSSWFVQVEVPQKKCYTDTDQFYKSYYAEIDAEETGIKNLFKVSDRNTLVDSY